MKFNMLTCAPLCLLCFWLLPISSQKTSNQAIPLSMVKDAVDDMYNGCRAKMEQTVKDQYFKKETSGNSQFGKAWKEAENCTKKALKKKEKIDQALTEDHMKAICVYTAERPKIYDVFNEAVRTNRKVYGTFFKYHSLHYWLTSAVQILRNNQNCWNTYRRTNAAFTGSVNRIIRFGSFTSSSLFANLTQFGDKTCFKIETCLGAYLKNYSYFKTEEQEVLIPPYEMFKITKNNEVADKLADCKSVYSLESVGLQSNLNCKAARNSKRSRLAVW
ncbi:T-cell ecto-ADP-ribosyltransferase 1-like [Mugil cephalus]|uniref:T-cell ecto-ADP-ribosyltransferase 1-like n=1 Tax=Mugil cephalus TaxID=48193 RepID=UPI001FB6E1E0|nr:T-cell ecto-ADP-ribosyltransferase 1-like [Mugil cephalus]